MWWWLACHGPDGAKGGGPGSDTDPAPAHSAFPPTEGPLRFRGAPPRNLVVLSLDTARKDHFSRWDPLRRDLTPFLEARMAEGVVLDDLTHCSNWTVASSACLFWGASLVDAAPSVGMVPILGPTNTLLEEVPDHPGLAHALTDAGYETLLSTANPWFGLAHGSVQGFTRYFPGSSMSAEALWAATTVGLDNDPVAAPFYLHLHFFEPHDPYLPDPAFLPATMPDPGVPLDTNAAQEDARALFPTMTPEQQAALVDNFRLRYAAEFAWFDAQIAEVWDGLDARGLLDDALVVFVTDHGEALYEKEYFGHAYYLPPAENDAVAFFWAKNLVPGVVAEPHVSVDLAPTLLDLLGVPVPATMTGQVLGRDAPRTHRTAFTDAFAGPVNAVREGDLMLQFSWQIPASPVFVCDTRADPDCLRNRYDPSAPSASDRHLWSLLEPEIRAVEPFVAPDPRVPGGPPWPPELVGPTRPPPRGTTP